MMTERLIREAIDLADRVDAILELDRAVKRVYQAPSVEALRDTDPVYQAHVRVVCAPCVESFHG